MGVYTQSAGSNWLSRRGTFLLLLVMFHALLLWALASGFAVKFVQSITEPLKVDIIEVKEPEEPPPPPPPVKAVELPPVSVPPVLVNIQIPVESPPIQITTAPPPPGPPAPPAFGPPAPPAPPAPSGVIVKYSVSKPDVQDFYPPTSTQLGETGRPVVRVCWDEKGKIISSDLVEPSGKKRLDDAAVKYGLRFKVKPGTADGKPAAECIKQPVLFKLD